MADTSDMVTFQVVMMAQDGSSVLDAREPVTAENVSKFRIPGDRVARISAELERLGFEIQSADSTTLSVAGPRSLVAETFGLDVDGAGDEAARGTRMPESLTGLVADVFVTPGPELFP